MAGTHADAAHAHRRARWPLVIVITALLLLAAVPFIVERVQAGRHAAIERVLIAQATLNDLEEGIANIRLALASERIARTRGWQDSAFAITARHVGGEEQVSADLARLVVQTQGLGDSTMRAAAAIDSLLRTAALIGHAPQADEDRALARARDAATELEQRLAFNLIEAQRELAFVDTLNRDVALVLVPVALAAVVLVAMLGRRAATAALEAEQGRAALARAVEEKEVLIRGVTHDLKNPLGAAMAYAELLRDGIGTDDLARRDNFLRSIEQLLRAALATVSDLLELARADTTTPEIHRVVTDVGGLVTGVAEGFRAKAESEGLALDVHVPLGRAPAVTDEARLTRIVENLLSNAVKFTPTGGRVVVSLEHDGGRYVISVADTGPGIPQALQERVFEEYFRVPGEMAPGAGIGLAISRKMARLLGGDITLHDRAGGGSVFEVSIPADELAVARSVRAV
jgi:signal transduction histidine kinase